MLRGSASCSGSTFSLCLGPRKRRFRLQCAGLITDRLSAGDDGFVAA